MFKKLLISISAMLLIAHCSIQSITPMQAAATAHARAAYERHEDIDPAIIQMIHDVVEQIAVPNTIADYAAAQNWDKVMELVRKPGMNINARDEMNRTVLMYAAEHGRLDMVKLFVGMKDNRNNSIFDLNARDSNGDTVLITAAYRGYLEIAQYLMEINDKNDKRIINPNAQDSRGRTALMWAAAAGHLNLVQYLTRKDINGNFLVELNARDDRGRNALRVAYDNRSSSIAVYLENLEKHNR